MNTLSKRVVFTTKQEYYATHLVIINPFLPQKLHPKEIEVLACFMSLSGDLVEENRLCKSARKLVRDKLNLSYGGLGNYITVFENKGFIKYDEKGNARIPLVLFPTPDVQKYNFEIIFEE